MDVRDKKILITGGTTGIGRATALLLCEMGAKIVIFGREKEPLEEVIALSHNKIVGLNADVAEIEDIEKIFSFVDNTLGGLDVLINNAALGGGDILSEDTERIKYLIKTNVQGYILCTKYALERMGNCCQIVNIGSMSTITKEEGTETYVASKSAIKAFSDSLRKEINKRGIKLTVIEPGSVDTDMQPQSQEQKNALVNEHKMLKSTDIAEIVLFVLSQSDRTEITNIQVKPAKQII